MKRLSLSLGAVLALFLSGLAHANEAVKDIPVGAAGTATAVSISTSAWTQVPATSTLSSRSLLKFRNKASNSASVICTCETTTPTIAITIGDIEVQPGENPPIQCDDNMKLYCVSLHTSAETINVKEYRQ